MNLVDFDVFEEQSHYQGVHETHLAAVLEAVAKPFGDRLQG